MWAAWATPYDGPPRQNAKPRKNRTPVPNLLLSFKRIQGDSRILIHGFLSPNETQSEKDLEDHARDCPKFGPAYRNEETIEHSVTVDEIPEFDEDAIGEWLDELFGLEGGEETEEEEEPEEEGEEEEEEEEEEK